MRSLFSLIEFLDQKLYVTHPLRMIQYKGRLSLRRQSRRREEV